MTSLEDAQALSGLSRPEIRRLNRLYAERQRVSRVAGNFASDAVLGRRLAESNRHLAALRHGQHITNERLKKLEHAQKENAKHTGDAVGKQINGATGRGTRKARRP